MMLAEAADAAAFDLSNAHLFTQDNEALRQDTTRAIARAFWAYVWPRIKDDRLKVSVWIFNPSVKVAALKPFFALIFGEAPPDA